MVMAKVVGRSFGLLRTVGMDSGERRATSGSRGALTSVESLISRWEQSWELLAHPRRQLHQHLQHLPHHLQRLHHLQPLLAHRMPNWCPLLRVRSAGGSMAQRVFRCLPSQRSIATTWVRDILVISGTNHKVASIALLLPGAVPPAPHTSVFGQMDRRELRFQGVQWPIATTLRRER